jgi:hypothetical protein
VVSIYEIRDDSQEKCKLSLRQGYVDPDEKEVFYSCAFGGRSGTDKSISQRVNHSVSWEAVRTIVRGP